MGAQTGSLGAVPPARARPLSPLAGRQDLTCVGNSSASSSSPSPSLATIALPMSAPSVRSASRWIAGCRRTAGGVQARWGARPAGGTLYTGPATIAVTWRRPPPRAPLLHRRPPRAPAGRLPSSLPPGPRRVPSALCLRRPGDPGAAGGRRRRRLPQGCFMFSPGGQCAGWRRPPSDSHTGPGANSRATHAAPRPGPKFPLFPRTCHLIPQKKSREPPAQRAASSPGSSCCADPDLGFLKSPPHSKGDLSGFVGLPDLARGTGRRRRLYPSPGAPSPSPRRSLCFWSSPCSPGWEGCLGHPTSASSREVGSRPPGAD